MNNNEIKNTIKTIINECVANYGYKILSEIENKDHWAIEFDTDMRASVYQRLFKEKGLKRGKMFSASHRYKKDKYIAVVAVFNN